MTVIPRKYNPGFLTDQELIASFCVRTDEFDSMIEVLHESTGRANTHQIVIGPRGSGKTSLLLRVSAEIRRREQLSTRFFPIIFSEESYEVSTAGEFWLECLSRLADQAPRGEGRPDLRLTYDELHRVRDDRMLGERCLGVLQDFADQEDKRLVLIVENLNMLLADIGDEDTGWQMRHTLQTEPRILLLASATSRFDEIDNPSKALYDLFRVLSLHPLDKDECMTLWKAVTGHSRPPETIQALRILTGGSPRLLSIVARFGATLSFRELMSDLLDLVDDHTEYFKSHIDALPAQERKVYLALADLWKPATAREVADRARLETSQCSAQLRRLTGRGAVEVTSGIARRKLYYVAERFYNIYYLLRRSRGPDALVEALIQFMEGFYLPSQLKELGVGLAKEFMDGNAVLAALVDESKALMKLGDPKRAIATCDEVIRRTNGKIAEGALERAAAGLVHKGVLLTESNRREEAASVWEEVVRRFERSNNPTLRDAVELALLSKATFELESGRPKVAIEVVNSAFERERAQSSEAKWQWLVIRARALLAEGNIGAGSKDLESLLTILPTLEPFPKIAVYFLVEMALDLDPKEARELILASPMAELLLPLTTALDKALGLDTKVAKEIEEVADDILRSRQG